ncbi:MAG: hypothetical protein ABFD54_17200 [Armatimonadota bacterium]
MRIKYSLQPAGGEKAKRLILNAFGLEKNPVDFCGGHVSSTKQSKTKFLSTKNLGDVKAGAFVVLRAKFVFSGDV